MTEKEVAYRGVVRTCPKGGVQDVSQLKVGLKRRKERGVAFRPGPARELISKALPSRPCLRRGDIRSSDGTGISIYELVAEGELARKLDRLKRRLVASTEVSLRYITPR